ALDTSRILIQFEFPQGAQKMSVYRDGVLVTASTNPTATSYINAGLNEGQTYTFTCEATLTGGVVVVGYNALTVATLSFNSPVFSGLESATAVGPRSVVLSWFPPSSDGVAASTYRVYFNPGTSVDWSVSPRLTVSAGKMSATLNNLGDELPYAFGVRACSAAGNCDNNTMERTLILTDGGAPSTQGALSAVTQ